MTQTNQLICISNNKCPSCLKEKLSWNIQYSYSDMELFKCGHGVCKDCYHLIDDDFSCPVCGDLGQLHNGNNGSLELQKWKTFNEWYSDYGLYIESGVGHNIIKYTSFGKQLLRIINNSKKNKNKKTSQKNKRF